MIWDFIALAGELRAGWLPNSIGSRPSKPLRRGRRRDPFVQRFRRSPYDSPPGEEVAATALSCSELGLCVESFGNLAEVCPRFTRVVGRKHAKDNAERTSGGYP